jgi:hypothetical protein
MVAVLWLAQQTEVAYKPAEQYEVKLDYRVQQRTAPPPTTVNLDDTRKQPATGMLPYVDVLLKIKTLAADEVRVRIENSDTRVVTARKVKAGDEVKIKLGFTDDMKDRVTAHRYTVLFLTEGKVAVSRIVLEVGEDGLFTVNGVTRGKF